MISKNYLCHGYSLPGWALSMGRGLLTSADPPYVRSCRTVEPVSSRDLRLEMTFGQPADTAAMNFEGSRSMVWVMESLTAVPLGSSSIVHRDSPSALSSGLKLFCQRITKRRGGAASTISPASRIWPCGDTIFQEDPAIHWLSQCTPNQYCFM